MKKCYFNLMGSMMAATAILVGATSCSDDEKTYSDDIYFTGNQKSVVVVGPAASNLAGVDASAFSITFDAASNWQLSAKNFFDQSQNADWVSFKTAAGEEGSHILGVYVTANNSGTDRAALVGLSANGKSVSFTLVQQAATAVANPNVAAINSDKVLSRIEYYAAGATSASETVDFMYDANGVLASETFTTINGDDRVETVHKITTDSRATGGVVGVNKVALTLNNQVVGSAYAVVNGLVADGYNSLVVKNNSNALINNFSYDNAFLSKINGASGNLSLAWSGNNMSHLASGESEANLTYGEALNDCNLDLNWFIGLQNVSLTAFDFHILGAMNLIGKRSANLISANSSMGENYTYTDGVTDKDGKPAEGMTVTTSTNRTIKVFFAE